MILFPLLAKELQQFSVTINLAADIVKVPFLSEINDRASKKAQIQKKNYEK
jgi:hypothetical protein